MRIIQQLHEQISGVCPIAGVSIGTIEDKATWRIDFADAATPAQRASAVSIVAAFDVTAAQQQEGTRDQRRLIDAQELQAARLDNAVVVLVDATPAERIAWANTNFPTLTPVERARMGMVMNMIAVSMRPQLR